MICYNAELEYHINAPFFLLIIAAYFDLWLNEKLLDHRLFQEDRDYKMHKSNKFQKKNSGQCEKLFLKFKNVEEIGRSKYNADGNVNIYFRTLTLWNNY